jgi:glutamate---cysteine ligase / carboxylate-amine ligase
MKQVPFKASQAASVGAELEFQIINPGSMALEPAAKDFIRNIQKGKYEKNIKPEITQSMIEINSSVHTSVKDMLAELSDLHNYLRCQARKLGVMLCGGGTHPFQKWSMQKIFPTSRYKKLSKIYRILSQRSTVFALHIHVGCKTAEDALYLTHALARYVPHFIAICASSPFYQGVDTGYYSSRFIAFNSFPSSGTMPYFTSWNEFSEYYYKMRNLGIIESMKDIYWEVRPKPEFGTVELRVSDCPLTIKKAVLVVAYLQALALYLMEEKPDKINHDLYYLYGFNRFQAARYGVEGAFINPYTLDRTTIIEDFRQTVKKIEHYANRLNNMSYITKLVNEVMNKPCDTELLRKTLKQTDSFQKVVAQQCKLWNESLNK